MLEEGNFRLEHVKLRQVVSTSGILRSERRTKCVHFGQGAEIEQRKITIQNILLLALRIKVTITIKLTLEQYFQNED